MDYTQQTVKTDQMVQTDQTDQTDQPDHPICPSPTMDSPDLPDLPELEELRLPEITKTLDSKVPKKRSTSKQLAALERGRAKLAEKRRLHKETLAKKQMNSIQEISEEDSDTDQYDSDTEHPNSFFCSIQ